MKVLFRAFECPFRAFECPFKAFECAFKAFERRMYSGSTKFSLWFNDFS